jgi:hypothetical protein
MSDEEKRNDAEPEEDEAETLLKRFPEMPPVPDVPETPKLVPKLPPHPEKVRAEKRIEAGSYNKMAIAATAASSFIAPIVLLGAGGWWLDQKLKHEVAWLAFLGVVVGFVVGVTSLLGTIRRLSE